MIMPASHGTTTKEKMIAAVVIVCTLVLACAGTVFTIRGQTTYLESTSKYLATLAEMIAVNSKASVTFQDPKDAEETLNTLRNEPSIILASLHNKRGQTLATYYRDNSEERIRQTASEQSPYISGFGNGLLTVVRIVVLNNEIIGTVRLQADLSPMFVMLKRDTATAITLTFFVSWGFMLLIYSSVKKNIKSLIISAQNDNMPHASVEVKS